MARTKPAPAPASSPELEPDAPALEGDDEDADPELRRAIAELGDDVGSVIIYRYPPEGGRRYYCGSMGAGEFSLDAVKQEYGGGKFHFRVQNSQGQYKASAYVTIDPRVQPRAERVTAAAPAGALGDQATFLMLTRILDRLDRQPAAPTSASDPMELTAKLGTIAAQQTASMVALVTGMMGKKGGGGDGLDAAGVVDIIRLGMELAGERGGNGGGSDSYGPVLELGRGLLQLAQKGGTNDVAKPAPGPVGSGGPGTALVSRGGAPPADPPAVSGPPWIPIVRPFVPQLIERAKVNKSAERIAWDLEEDHPTAYDWLRGQLGSPERDTFINAFFTAFPAANDYRAWFLELFAAVVDTGEEPTPADVEDDGA